MKILDAQRKTLAFLVAEVGDCGACGRELDPANTLILTPKGGDRSAVACGECYEGSRARYTVNGLDPAEGLDIVDGRKIWRMA